MSMADFLARPRPARRALAALSCADVKRTGRCEYAVVLLPNLTKAHEFDAALQRLPLSFVFSLSEGGNISNAALKNWAVVFLPQREPPNFGRQNRSDQFT
jgi:hypothetical protein